MAHIKNRLRGLLVAFVALVAALAIVPGVAQAMPWLDGEGTPTGTGSIVLEFGEGELPDSADATTIKVYKVADITLKDDDTNVTEIRVGGQTEGALYNAVVAWADSENPTAAEAKAVVDLVDKETTFDQAQFTLDGNSVTISNLPAGVYYIEVEDNETYAYQSMIASVEPYYGDNGQWEIGPKADVQDAVEVIDVKCVAQGFNKEIVDSISGDDHVYNVGDELKYEITFNVAPNMAEFWIEDSLTGADFVDGSVVLHIGEETFGLESGLFTAVKTSDTSFKFTLNANGIARVLENGSSEAKIAYTATVNEDASLATGVTNIAKSSESGSDEAKQEFGGIKVYKYDSETTKALQGAVFGLYSNESCSEEIARATTDKYGVATFNVMLDLEKTYWVKEISAPAGFKLDTTAYAVHPAGTEDAEYVLAAGDYIQVEVPNTPSDYNEGIDLPQTGGMGTVALTAAGVVLVAGAAAFIIRSRKEN